MRSVGSEALAADGELECEGILDAELVDGEALLQNIHPGQNVGKGKDDTLFAKVTGTVRFENFGKNRKRVSVVAAN
jgi:hypothetical protein